MLCGGVLLGSSVGEALCGVGQGSLFGRGNCVRGVSWLGKPGKLVRAGVRMKI